VSPAFGGANKSRSKTVTDIYKLHSKSLFFVDPIINYAILFYLTGELSYGKNKKGFSARDFGFAR